MSYRSTKSRFHLLALGLLLCVAPAFGQGAPDITLKVSPAELKIIANAMAARPDTQTLALTAKLQAQIDVQFPPGPYSTPLPLPAIEGTVR
jgi:hypothetical protein